MLTKISKLVEDACKKETNVAGYGAWTHHICSVVEYSKILAEKLSADMEIVKIAALLHDYSDILDKNLYYEEHHIHSAKFAEEILSSYNYPQDRIEQVRHCIMAHRASKNIPRETLEAEIVANADAMAHFDNVNSLLYLSFVRYKMDTDEGTNWVLKKLERSWGKLTLPEAKEIIVGKYEAIKIVFK